MRFLPSFLAITSGAVLSFAFPRWDFSHLSWIWMFPLLIALWNFIPEKIQTPKARAWRGFRLGYLAGLAFFLPNLAWVRHSSRVISGATDHSWMGIQVEFMGIAAVLGLCGFLSLYWGVWGAIAATLGRVTLSAPATTAHPGGRMFSSSLESLRSAFICAAAWVAMEWLRSIIFTGFPWNGLAIPLRLHPAFVQSADLVGVIGLSFLPVFITCIAYNTVVRFRQEIRTSRVRPHLDFFCASLLLISNFGYGVSRLLEEREEHETVPLRVLLVQLNIPQLQKWAGRSDEETALEIYDRYAQMTELGVRATQPDLVIWPESALPHPFHSRFHVTYLDNLLKLGDFSLLTGTDILIPGELDYTGVALLRRDFENHQLYRKVCLVPFGEYLPLRDVPGVEALLGGVLAGDFHPGDSTEPLILEKPEQVQIIPLVCFEDTFGRFARKFVREAPQLIVNCTNDGWFLFSEENEQHLANAVFRCIELRRPMARACNTGVTCFVDAWGRVVRGDQLADPKTGSVFISGFLPKELELIKKPEITFYARYGDIFSISLLAITGVAVLLALMAGYRKQKRKGAADAPDAS